MVSHTHRCIFVHIPRAAGTSLKSVLESADLRSVQPREPFRSDDDKFHPPPPHLRAGDHIAYGLVTPEQFDAYFKFTFVRNPWDRLVSEYKYRRHPLTVDFKTYVFEQFPQPDWSDEYCHIIPQYDFLYDASGTLLVDFVGRLENIRQDFATVCKRIGLLPTTLPHKNRAEAVQNGGHPLVDGARAIRELLSLTRWRNTFPHYADYYDSESRDFVARLYRNDIEAFGYRFGN